MHIILFAILLSFSSSLLAEPPAESAEAKAWREYTDQLREAGLRILNAYPQPTDLDRAEGLRYLLQQVGAAAEQVVLRQPEQISLLRLGATTINKWGLDGADVKYQGARISADGSYRFHGRLGSARLFALQVVGTEGGYAAHGALTGDQLRADSEGNFEVWISARKPEQWQGAWLELEPSADTLLVREYFSDWENERPGEYRLERVDDVNADPTVTTAQMAALLNASARAFAVRASQWQSRVEMARQHQVNSVVMRSADEQGLPSNVYGSGWFRIAPDEALVIEMDAPEALLWSVQLGNVWWESLDYINHLASYNDSQAQASSDGKYRFVLSLKDPGVPNWLDPVGHAEGAILFRLQGVREIVQPTFKLVALSDLSQHLPGDTPHIGIEQRRAAISARREHAAARWAP